MTPAAKVIIIFIYIYIYTYTCYATVRSLARADLRHAPLLYVLWHLYTHVMLFYCTFTCTQMCDLLPAHTNKGWGWVGWGNNVHLCAHRSCYAEDVLVLRHAWGKLGQNWAEWIFTCTILHTCKDTLLCTWTDTHTHGVLRRCKIFSCTCTQTHTHMWDATF